MPGQPAVIATLVYIFLCMAMGITILLLIRFMTKVVLKTERHNRKKENAYECGVPLFEEDARHRFGVRFYLVALSFVLFDVETVFLLPYAVCYKQLGAEGFYAMLVFVGILTLGLFYELRRGLLDWSNETRDETRAAIAQEKAAASAGTAGRSAHSTQAA